MTFSYTAAFWTWADWELELDWMALRGINLPLAWVGVEKIFIEVFQQLGMTDTEISSFLSGPAFQAWNRFGNIQGSWGGALPMEWVNDQFDLQKQIVKRMVDLGMTPVLPAFPGFVPRAITRIMPNATVVNGSQWNGFQVQYTNDTFLEPFDPLFTQLQKSFISKQTAAYGNITHIYTLDQYNENDPYSGDVSYLRNVTSNTIASLKAADSQAVWLMQGWLFYSSSTFWTNARIEAYLGGVTNNDDMLILDLFSESQPQWQRTNSYYGKPWIWCELHDYGGNMGIYGQVENVTINAIEATMNSSSLVGFGLTPEGQEGNEIMYDLLLDQAWSRQPINTSAYFHSWATTRYSYTNTSAAPQDLYTSWDILRTTAYNNTNLTSNAVSKSIFELRPNTTGLLNRTGHHPTTVNYAYASVVHAWSAMYNASATDPELWQNDAYLYDLTDLTRQVMANAFIPLYQSFIASWNSNNTSSTTLNATAQNMFTMLIDLDSVLSTNPDFRLSSWIDRARSWASTGLFTGPNGTNVNTTLADFYEYDARNQITLWGPRGEISDYASKQWGGLISGYYVPRWSLFLNYLVQTSKANYSTATIASQISAFELGWQTQHLSGNGTIASGDATSLKRVLETVVAKWPDVFRY